MDDRTDKPGTIVVPVAHTPDAVPAEHRPERDQPEIDGQEERPDTVPVLLETVSITKRRVSTGRVRVRTKTEHYRAFAEAELDRNTVDVKRVVIGRVVNRLPPVRTEGSTTIVPVVEERLVVVKQLFLTEELHITQNVRREAVRQPVQLRRQRVVIERVDVAGRAVGPIKSKS